MGMQSSYRVHTSVNTHTPVEAEIDGQPTMTQVPTVEVELTVEDGSHGTVVLRFRGSKADEARAFFTPGKTVIATWA